jgi:hypothetical protein
MVYPLSYGSSLGANYRKGTRMTTTTEATVAVTATEYALFPFTYAGKSFNSKVKANTRKLATIQALPAGVFSNMNAQCLSEISTITASTTRDQDLAELERINAGGSWAIIELAGE